MPVLPRAAGGFASLIMSDSEPDFDDVAMVKAIPSRGHDQKSNTLKGSNKLQNDSANDVTKSVQCLEPSHNGGRNVSHAAQAREVLIEKTKNRSLTGISNSSHKPPEKSASYDSCSLVKKEGRSQHKSKRPPNGKDRLDYNGQPARSIDNDMAHNQTLQAIDVAEHAESPVASTGSQGTVCGGDANSSEATSIYDAGEFIGRKQSDELRTKYHALEARHAELRDIGVKAAESNFERLKRQSMETAAASTTLIRELKAELAAQFATIKQNEQIGRQLEDSKSNVGELERTVAELTASLAKARSEVQSLSAKLAASKAVEAGVKMSASMIKTVNGVARSTPSEAVLAAQAKEDLYGDLTGLIVRGVSQIDSANVFDCIQTGRNGTLHFKLALEAGEDPENYDEIQFTYKPQLDRERDRDLMTILPDYLVEEITFTRTQASKFYNRLNKSLTERQVN
ncbi:hypothetical protein E4U41_003136 [Claviceps citrina]|nr:hypothetical protein E4U41_003136 [Claviceps citrina]